MNWSQLTPWLERVCFVLPLILSNHHLSSVLLITILIVPIEHSSAAHGLSITLSALAIISPKSPLDQLTDAYCLVHLTLTLVLTDKYSQSIMFLSFIIMRYLDFPTDILVTCGVVYALRTKACKILQKLYTLSNFEYIIALFFYGILYKLHASYALPDDLRFACCLLYHTLHSLVIVSVVGIHLPADAAVTRTLYFIIYATLLLTCILLDNIAGTNPVEWLWNFLTQRQRTLVLAFWSTLLAACIPLIHWTATHTRLPLVITRKLFHFLACLLFIPIIATDIEMMTVSFSIALAIQLVLEVACSLDTPVITDHLKAFYALFQGDKRSLHHLYLVLGCALPVFFRGIFHGKARGTGPLLGVLTVGIGDSFVSTFDK